MQTQQKIPSMNKKCGNISCSPTAVNDKKVNSKMYNELPLKEFWKPNLNFVKFKEPGATLKTI